MTMGFIIFESFILASSCSIDAFSASFAYGSKRIRIPFLSNQIINIICSLILGGSLWAGAAVRPYLPGRLAAVIAFAILFIIGITKLLDSVTKTIIRRHNKRKNEVLNKKMKFSMFNFKFILNLYADPEEADTDSNKIISPFEAAALAISLSLDGIAVGFGAAIGNVNVSAVFLASFITNTAAVMSGCYLGNKLAGKLPFNISWLSGAIFIALAVSKLL